MVFELFSSRVQEQGRNGVLQKIRQPMGGFVFGAVEEIRKIIKEKFLDVK